ncbi:MAG: DUF5615 family PIN-like protein [Reyranella sp.]|nr:DUF5615 family PIN-like protein [Reyranella sp.]
MRFLADENVARPIVEGLRAAGLDVESIGETKAGASDSQVVEAARQGGRVLVTEDRDFGEMIVRQKLDLRGVILLELARLSNAAAAARVREIVEAHMGKLDGNLLVVEPARVRLRPMRP